MHLGWPQFFAALVALAGVGSAAALGFAETAIDLAEIYQGLLARNELAGFEVTQRFYEVGSPAGLEETQRYIVSKEQPR